MDFIFLGDKLNASGGCKAAVKARTTINLERFMECGQLLLGNKFLRKSIFLLRKNSNDVWK